MMWNYLLGFGSCVVLYFVAGVVVLALRHDMIRPLNGMECWSIVLMWPFFAMG